MSVKTIDFSRRLRGAGVKDDVGENKKPMNFTCRVCGSDDYKEEYYSNGTFGPAGKNWRAFCICSGCSVIFKDPEKFSKK